MGTRSIFILLFSLLLAPSHVSTAKVPSSDFEPVVIFSENEQIPDYSPSNPINVYVSHKSCIDRPWPVEPKCYMEHLPGYILAEIIGYLDDRSLGKLSQTSVLFHNMTGEAFELLMKCNGIRDDLGLSRRDISILVLNLQPFFKISYPGLVKHQLSVVDRIFLSLLATLVGSKSFFSEKCVVLPQSSTFTSLQSSFLRLDFFKNNFKYPGPVIDNIFQCPGLLSFTLFKIIRNYPIACIPYTLEALSTLSKNKTLFANNPTFNIGSFPVGSLGVSMSSKDQRFLNNYLKTLSSDELVGMRIGCHHILHELIIKNGNYCHEIFSRPELENVPRDRETSLPFYSAALNFAILNSNVPFLTELLNHYPDEKFSGYPIEKLNQLRNNKDNLLAVLPVKKVFPYLHF